MNEPQPHKLPRDEDVETVDTGRGRIHIVNMANMTPQNAAALGNFAAGLRMSELLGTRCEWCGGVFDTEESLDGAVASYHGVAHELCWQWRGVPTDEMLRAVLEQTLEVTDEWGGAKLAGWRYGSNVLVGGLDEAIEALRVHIASIIQPLMDLAARHELTLRGIRDYAQIGLDDPNPNYRRSLAAIRGEVNNKLGD